MIATESHRRTTTSTHPRRYFASRAIAPGVRHRSARSRPGTATGSPARSPRMRITIMAVSRKNPTTADPFKLTMMIFAVIAFLYFTGEVLKPLALSVLLSFSLVPAVRLLEGRRVPRAVAVVLTIVVAMGLLGGVGYLVGQQLTALAKRLPDYQENIEKKLSGVFKPGQRSAGTR